MTANDPSPTLLLSGKRKGDLAEKRAQNLRANLMRRKMQAKERDAELATEEPESERA